MQKNTDKVVWDFVEMFYPNYTSSNLIAKANDLECICYDGGIKNNKLEPENLPEDSPAQNIAISFLQTAQGDKEVAAKKATDYYNYLHMRIYQDAIENFIQSHSVLEMVAAAQQLSLKKEDAYLTMLNALKLVNEWGDVIKQNYPEMLFPNTVKLALQIGTKELQSINQSTNS